MLTIATLSLASAAFANGAMGLALEVFSFGTWIVYVLATIVMEAWVIGPAIGKDSAQSFMYSLFFNFLTASCCASGFFAPGLHPEEKDMNPLLWTVVLLSIFGLISAFFESIMWRSICPEELRSLALKRTFLAHLYGVPLALGILLIPSRPYVGWESGSNFGRGMEFYTAIDGVYLDRVDKDGNVRQFKDERELEQALVKQGKDPICLYPAVYHRFDTHDHLEKPWPIEFNRELNSETTWLIRIRRTRRNVVFSPEWTIGTTDGAVGYVHWKFEDLMKPAVPRPK